MGRADRLVETSRDVAAVREVLRGAEERTLAEIAVVLAEATESVARALEVVWEGQLILPGSTRSRLQPTWPAGPKTPSRRSSPRRTCRSTDLRSG